MSITETEHGIRAPMRFVNKASRTNGNGQTVQHRLSCTQIEAPVQECHARHCVGGMTTRKRTHFPIAPCKGANRKCAAVVAGAPAPQHSCDQVPGESSRCYRRRTPATSVSQVDIVHHPPGQKERGARATQEVAPPDNVERLPLSER